MSTFRTPQVVLFSDDLPRAVAFYTRLGFAETFQVPADNEPVHVDLSLDGYKIGIGSVASTRDDHGLDPIARANARPSSSGRTTLPPPTRISWQPERLPWHLHTHGSTGC